MSQSFLPCALANSGPWPRRCLFSNHVGDITARQGRGVCWLGERDAERESCIRTRTGAAQK